MAALLALCAVVLAAGGILLLELPWRVALIAFAFAALAAYSACHTGADKDPK